MSETGPSVTALEQLREALSMAPGVAHEPRWRFVEADERFTWLLDDARAVVLLDRAENNIELRCAGPESACPPATVPKYYHVPAYEGVRLIYTWRLSGKGAGKVVSARTTTTVEDGEPVIRYEARWSDGSDSRSTARVRYDQGWGAYVVEMHVVLDTRRATTPLEYCNILPAGIGDTRPGRERHPFTFWQHPDGLRKLIKNPLWFTSVGAQDLTGERHIAQGGFLGFGPDDRMNPVIEIVASSPETGGTTCDNLQDEHILAFAPEGRHAAASGWFHLEAQYRVFSIPRAMAEEIVARAEPMTPGAMLAWKFQYPPIPELPRDLTGVELPGSPCFGKSDWSRPVPWDRPYAGRLWTASPDPEASIHYDRSVGHAAPGAIRLRVDGPRLYFAPGSGHTLYIEERVTYRFSMWVRTRGQATGWIEAPEIRFRRGDSDNHASAVVGPDTDWTHLEVLVIGRGEEAPFTDTVICAEGKGEVWFSDMTFERVDGAEA